eukprot:5630829-Pyramimonas_sp.AAC.1
MAPCRCPFTLFESSVLSYYNPAAERLGCLPISTPQSTMIFGMRTANKIFLNRICGQVAIRQNDYDGFVYENNQWVLGWTRYHHGPH